MDVVVKSRHCEVSDRFREHVEEKLGRLEKHDHRVIRVEVEVEMERNPRLADRAVKVELTAFSKGPVIRAEAAAEDKMAALDMAVDKMATQMRRAADRRRIHRGRHTPVSVAQALAGVDQTPNGTSAAEVDGEESEHRIGTLTVTGDGPLVVREKTHTAAPMTLGQALYEMELVGHDFFLFVDQDNDRPSVVYRRKGYDYGVIALERRCSRCWSTPGGGGQIPRKGVDQWAFFRRGVVRTCHDPSVAETQAVPRSGPEGIRVLVVDDQELFRRGLTMLLGVEDDIEVVAEAADGAAAAALAATHHPDVVLMDVRMPKLTGIEACVAIKEASPAARIIMLTVSDEEADLYEAVKNGASGYLLKDSSIDEVAQAVRVVADGQSLISPSMAIKLLDEFKQMSRTDRQSVPTPRLTERELEVLRLVATGLNNREIAKQLFISENTVKNHVRNILEKLQLHSRMEAVMYAVREKLLDIP